MPLTKTNTGSAIRGRVNPNQAQRRDCQEVIARVNFADLGRGARTLYTVGVARLDMQGHTAEGDANLQVQIGGGTVAAAIIANTVQRTTNLENQRGVSNGVISVLTQSLDTGTVWNLTGSLP
ncbi:MAG: hypothetical protein IM605_02505 [Cytophagales bacterium]|jgi:hypothetical protein|nr:hypothetical protein [Cytophagales bacterium]MCA6400880.1 hypothetical protein [Cytophagales bacterium]